MKVETKESWMVPTKVSGLVLKTVVKSEKMDMPKVVMLDDCLVVSLVKQMASMKVEKWVDSLDCLELLQKKCRNPIVDAM